MSSLINKGPRIVPKKGAARRRPGLVPGLTPGVALSDAASVTSARSSLEPSATPQPDPLRAVSIPPPGLPTPELSQVTSDVPESSEGGPRIQITGQPARSTDGIPAITLAAPRAGSTAPPSGVNDDAIPSISVGTSRRRSPSPAVNIHASKRRRIDTEDLPARTASPAPAGKPVRVADDDEIPVIQVAKTSPKAAAKAKAAEAKKRKAQDGLVQYETPEMPEGAAPASQPSSSTQAAKRRQSRPAVAPLLMASITGPKPRAKGTRRNQWQITTPMDLAAARARDGIVDVDRMGEAVFGEEALNGEVVPKLRKVRKDKGVKKGPMIRIEDEDDEDGEEDGEEDATSPPRRASASRSTRVRMRRATKEDLASAATQGRAIAPQPRSAPSGLIEPTDDAEAEIEAEGSEAPTSIRLRNAQKRRAKMLAKKKATSSPSARDTAVAIDEAIAQSIEAPAPPGRRRGQGKKRGGPVMRVQAQEARSGSTSRSRRASTAATDSSSVSSAVTEGGTPIRRKKRYHRQPTPEGNETVFIAEKVTPLMALLGRDTENRVGMRSNTEMLMRTMDWKQIKRDNRSKMEEMAILKGSKKTNNFDVILGITNDPILQVQATESPQSAADDDPAEREAAEQQRLDEALALGKERYGDERVGQIVEVNGQHRMLTDEAANRNDADEIDAQVLETGVADVTEKDIAEDDLRKQRFNVHTFVKWKRKDPKERIYQSSRWSDEETEKFYEALRCCGVDFGSMVTWFPDRIRRSLKRKFNIEERANPERVNETLDAHMMIVASGSGEGRDDGTAWDMSQFHENGNGIVLRDPREVEEELAKIRKEREVEIEAARQEYEAEKLNKKAAGVPDSEDEEEEEGEEEEDESDLYVGDRIQKEMMEKKRLERERAAAMDSGAEDEEGEAEEEEEEVMPTVEPDDEGQLATDDEDVDWDD